MFWKVDQRKVDIVRTIIQYVLTFLTLQLLFEANEWNKSNDSTQRRGAYQHVLSHMHICTPIQI